LENFNRDFGALNLEEVLRYLCDSMELFS